MHRFLPILLAFFCLADAVAQQDTTFVQTLNFSDITKRRDWYEFPAQGTDYRKVLMYYTLKCDAATTQDQYACGEWDYLTYSYVYDHTGNLDSNLYNHPHYLVGTEPWTSAFAYTSTPQYNTTEQYQYYTVIDAINSETVGTIGTASTTTDFPFNGIATVARCQYLYTAAELQNAGLLAGDIDQLSWEVNAVGDAIANVRIRLAQTSATELHEFLNSGFSQHYYSQASFASVGTSTLPLLSPFAWDGSSSIVVEVSYTLEVGVNGPLLDAETTTDTLGVCNTGYDGAVEFDNSTYLQLPLEGYDFGDEITISFWAYGDPAVQPENSYAFEAIDANNNRVLNCHLPWSNERIYWDAGEGSGYDRIDKAATAAEYEGNWVHWALTKNATTGSMKIYKNGTLWHSGTGLNRSIGEVAKFTIGHSATGNGFWHGRMDEFQIWDVELDQSTIVDWMNRTVTASHPNWNDLVAYYDFNQLTTVSDATGNGNNAVLIGPPNLVAKALSEQNLYQTVTMERPVIHFVQADMVSHIDSVLVTSTTLAEATSITEFAVSGNTVEVLGTTLGYSGYTYTWHAEGTVDSTAIVTDQLLENDTLWYYGMPYEVIDRYEIGRFITPYGIGLSLGPDGFTWMYDVTDYAFLLHDSVDFESGNQQELIDVKFAFIHGTPMADVVELSRPWGQSNSYSYGNLDNDVSLAATDVTVAPNAEHFKLKTRLTGHGHNTSNANGAYPHCCEWKDNTHYLRVNNQQAASWHIWQTHDCAQNPVYPQGGTWPGAREGWCPGDVVKDNDFIITDRVSGNSVNLDYDITPVPNNNPGMADGNYVIAMHLMQYGQANHQLDAEIYDVLSPSNWEYYSRVNPFCDDARIKLRNAGETTLTSATITYQVDGGTPQTYTWSGSLGFMEMEEVTLPIDNANFWQGLANGKFIVSVSNPNGSQDQYSGNDTYVSNFDLPPVYEGDFIVRYKTNNLPNENYWEIRDITGNVVATRTNSSANTTYMDTMNLTPGCYTFHLYDSGDDGLSYWAYPGQGTGFCRLKDNGSSAYLANFEAEFGGEITHGFSVGILASIAEHWDGRVIELYPNPTSGLFTLELSGVTGVHRLMIVDALGQVVTDRTLQLNGFFETRIDLSGANSGIYFVRIAGSEVNETRRLVIE